MGINLKAHAQFHTARSFRKLLWLNCSFLAAGLRRPFMKDKTITEVDAKTQQIWVALLTLQDVCSTSAATLQSLQFCFSTRRHFSKTSEGIFIQHDWLRQHGPQMAVLQDSVWSSASAACEMKHSCCLKLGKEDMLKCWKQLLLLAVLQPLQ